MGASMYNNEFTVIEVKSANCTYCKAAFTYSASKNPSEVCPVCARSSIVLRNFIKNKRALKVKLGKAYFVARYYLEYDEDVIQPGTIVAYAVGNNIRLSMVKTNFIKNRKIWAVPIKRGGGMSSGQDEVLWKSMLCILTPQYQK